MKKWREEDLLNRGKVRDIYRVPGRDDLLGIMTTDRISAFDEVVGEIQGRGSLLNRMSEYWKSLIVQNAIINNDSLLISPRNTLKFFGIKDAEKCEDNLHLVKKAQVIPVECIVRGYIAGSLWKQYSKNLRKQGYYFDNHLPGNLREAEKLPEPIFTPTTKAPKGKHDEPLNREMLEATIDNWFEGIGFHFEETNFPNAAALARKLHSVSLEIYNLASKMLLEKRVIVADTKFEFGFIWNPIQEFWELCLVDEVLTPDSSRFWSMDDYEVGVPPKSFDKQVLRDWLAANPGQEIPEDLKIEISGLYHKIFGLILYNTF